MKIPVRQADALTVRCRRLLSAHRARAKRLDSQPELRLEHGELAFNFVILATVFPFRRASVRDHFRRVVGVEISAAYSFA